MVYRHHVTSSYKSCDKAKDGHVIEHIYESCDRSKKVIWPYDFVGDHISHSLSVKHIICLVWFGVHTTHMTLLSYHMARIRLIWPFCPSYGPYDHFLPYHTPIWPYWPHDMPVVFVLICVYVVRMWRVFLMLPLKLCWHPRVQRKRREKRKKDALYCNQ